MSQSIIRRNNRTKYNDDEDDDNHSINNKVKYLTPRKYRTPQRTQLPNMNNEIPFNNKDEHTLTPSKYRLEKSDEDDTKLLYNKYPVIIGDFTLTKKSFDENSIYNYQPKRTQTSYVYQGIARSSEVQERAMNEMKQYVQSSSNPLEKKTPFINNRNHYQSMLSLPSNNYRSATDDDLIINHSENSSYDSVRRRNHSLTSVYPSNKPIAHDHPYYFGEQSEYISSDEDDEEEEEEDSSSEDEKCITFGRNSQPKPIRKYSSFIPPIINHHDEFIDIIFQAVVDVGTSTDDILSEDSSLNQQPSLITNQSSRSETETYRVSNPMIDHENYEEPDTVPFPTVKYPPSISASDSSTIRSNTNQIESNNYEDNSVDIEQSSTNKFDKQNNYYYDEESHQSTITPEPTRIIQRLPRKNLLVDSPRSRDENIPVNYEPEPNVSQKSIQSDKSRRSFFNLFNRQKSKDDKFNNKKKDDKLNNKKKDDKLNNKKKHKKKPKN